VLIGVQALEVCKREEEQIEKMMGPMEAMKKKAQAEQMTVCDLGEFK
jgi:hypothetical protein